MRHQRPSRPPPVLIPAVPPPGTVRRRRPAARPGAGGERWLYGRHAVAAALANPERSWRQLLVLAGHQAEAATLAATASAGRRGDGDPVAIVERERLDALLPGGAVHQGWALEVEALAEIDLDDVLRRAALAGGRATLVVLDQVTDPHNVGAVLRSAAAFGALAVIVTAHGAPLATGALAKAASGALEIVPLVRVVNLARTIERLKGDGFWVCGLDERAEAALATVDLGPRVALVLGAEDDGLRRLVREGCDHLARLPTRGAMTSLNVSNAAAVALYELARNG